MTSLPQRSSDVVPPATPAPEAEAEALDPDAFVVTHALCVKQVATVTDLAVMTRMESAAVQRQLALLEHAGEAVFRARHELWQLTPDGAARHKHRISDEVADNLIGDLLRQAYDDFLAVNVALDEQCSKWQLRLGLPNDHEDVVYDEAVIDGLEAIDQRADGILAAMSAALPRLGDYQPRLGAAYERIRRGDSDSFTGVSCDSYHDIWMQWHEDLILTLRIDRRTAGSG